MAESSTPVSNDQEIWWSSWLQTAKEKSSVALEFMKKDLTEFGQTVQQDAVSAFSATSSAVKQTLRLDDKDSVASQTKEGFQTLLGKITDAFYPSLDIEDEEMLVIRDSQPVTVEKWHAHLHYIQTHPSNYSHKPNGSKEQYQKWLENFSLEEYQKNVSDILVSSPDVRTLYTDIVPNILSNLEFWQRFFYRVYQENEIQAKRAELVKRAEKGESLDEFIWDVDEIGEQKTLIMAEHPKTLDTPSENLHEVESDVSVKVKSNISSTSSSDTDASKKANTEDEWEKDFDLDETNFDVKIASGNGKEEDWENWE